MGTLANSNLVTWQKKEILKMLDLDKMSDQQIDKLYGFMISIWGLKKGQFYVRG